MANIQPSETSTVIAAPIRDPSLGESGRQREGARSGGGEREQAGVPQSAHSVSIGGDDTNTVPAKDVHAVVAQNSVHEEGSGETQVTTQSPQPSFDTVTTMVQPQPQHPAAPLKRFTSVNINKRFLEKTTSVSGTSSGGNQLAGHAPSSVGGSGQRRRASPSSRSPSTDRPAPSRLVTAKLTAVQQPSAASTSGWLRTNSSTPGTSATPTPPSSSPQPTANGSTAPHASSAPSTGPQQPKRRPGEIPSQNGTPVSSLSSPTQQANWRPVWGKVVHPPSNVHARDTDRQMSDFPTAAEAAHGRKTKALNSQLAAETAAAQSAARKQAMNETAAAFRGVHLDPNAHHWDEMEDEDSDFLAGVIEFGDGTQYKIESMADSAESQDASSAPMPDAEILPSSKSPPTSHVSKEERFGEDFDRSWPRAQASTVRPTGTGSLPPRIVPPQQAGSHHSPTDPPTSGSAHSPYDGTSPTSRVLFNERLNRLEPWSNAKPRSSQAPGTTVRREIRGDHPTGLSRQQAPNRDPPLLPHAHPSPNVQLLQKGGAESAWKGGPPRGFNHAPPERGRWGSPSLRDEDRPWEKRRRESMSSSDAASPSARELSRDRDAGHGRREVGTFDHRDPERNNANANMPPPVLPQSLTRDRSRDGRHLAPHLSRMPPPPVPPLPGPEMLPDERASHAQPPGESPSASVRSQLSPTSEKAPPPSGEEGIDKDSLVKDAMQLAIERAKRRKQEGEEEEKQRSEAAERARKKAEALAAAQEEKKKAHSLPLTREDKVLEDSTHAHNLKMNGIQVAHKSPEIVGASKNSQTENYLPRGIFHRPPTARAINPSANLPRRPSIPPTVAELTPASQAESWRSKASPASPPIPQPPPLQGAFPPAAKGLELDLSVQPDEKIEVVDFSDLGKLIGRPSSPAPSSFALDTASTSTQTPIRTRRPAESDFFDDRPSHERLSPIKSDMPLWRRPALKPATVSPPQSFGEELGTQTMPIFLTDEPVPVQESSGSDPNISPSLNREASQSDQPPSNAGTQSVYVPPTVLALRSPRTLSHFKEAPMSTLTDTMSRIKGALDGMQSQDQIREKEATDQRPQAVSHNKPKTTEASSSMWRESRESRWDMSPQVTKILSPTAGRSSPREVFDITTPDPPRSPKPAWNAFIVCLPIESRPRDAISKKQLHFWNLPHPGVRWDILSWDPPVEGMNKRELSRDEIFHRKHAIKGGKLRVLLPNRRIVHHLIDKHQESSNASSRPVLMTAAGVKIKLPSNAPSSKENTGRLPRAVISDRSRESSVPSWRKSAMPLTQIKKDHRNPASSNGMPSDNELNTTSRSPPPEPSTPLPQFPNPNSGIASSSSPPSAQSATVSLPINAPTHSRASGPRRPSGNEAVFFRTSRGGSETESRKPLPRFTVTSELDRAVESASSPAKDNSVTYHKTAESAQPAVNSQRDSPRDVHVAEISPPGPQKKNSDDTASGAKPVTPPPTHTSSAWGKSPLSFSLKESPARSAPDPEHLKAVWSQPSGRSTVTTSNSLKGIADDLPSIPFTVQDMKSEDGETPPPTAPAPPPSRLSLQEVTRAFQQVPGGPPPVTSPSSRPPSYAATPLLSSAPQQSYRSNQAAAMALPPQHPPRPVFAPYPQSLVGHSPSPTLMYAPGISSPVAHHRMPVSSSSPPVAHPIWLPTPLPQNTQATAFMRAGPPPAPMMYPSPAPPGAPGHLMQRRDSVVSPPGGMPLGPTIYHGHPMDVQGHMHQTPAHGQSPHPTHAHPVAHTVPHMHHMFSPPQHGQAPTMYAVPIGAGRGGMVPRPGYEGMQQVPHLAPHNPGYQAVPPTSFAHPFQS